MSAPVATRPSPGHKLMSAVWGIRYFDLLALMALPTLGAAAAIRQPGLLPMTQLAFFSVFNFFFVVQSLLFTDWSARRNPAAPARRELAVAAVFAAVALAGFYFISPALFAAGLAVAILTVPYSHPAINLKGRPVVSTLVHFVGGGLYFFGGFIAFTFPTAKAVALTVFFGLVLAAGHFSYEIEYFPPDLVAHVRTNAIAFGQARVFRVGLGLFVFTSAFLLLTGAILHNGFDAACGAVLLAVWAVAAWHWRRWTDSDPIRPFRRFYRAVYALLAAALLLQRGLEWWW